ncbi:MAG: transcription antitermination factor NusB [Candidatus Thermofonsia Clade 1 bacterium]|jgi:N utilization substance protein B|uniref:Transcription antitermination protein NusB n=1 Tax=Candidatus Thermofonsia Clade 1 bacterium TaxID=2364210 RepID=A0A2M8PYW4_9CHLR|nr:MAG: transcription antitermination factor NusB [Candidatus Thermofonsia Clade 1 bacterium]PJF42751.1 MAG: transcription antitermination factor NusB [Candidatus Thermofonsia Clade 1 bacterium]RMF48989.1 MAG: transcription antitermination factor NusB [Chloroflexota bacterium]
MARAVALQALYELDCTNHTIAEVMQARLAALAEQGKVEAEVRRYAYRLVNGVREIYPLLDALIAQFAPEFPIEQMAIIDRNILRMALYEFAFGKQTPFAVAVDEAVELAKQFGAESTPRFVNGVLGALAPHTAALQVQLRDKANPT